MLFQLDNRGGGTLLAAHVTDFASTKAAWRWRHSARLDVPATPGLVFANAMPFIGSGASAGFGAGMPALRRQVLLTAWRMEDDFELFLEQPLTQQLGAATHTGWAQFDVASTRGSHYRSTTLASSDEVADGRAPPSLWDGSCCDRCRASSVRGRGSGHSRLKPPGW